MLLLVAAGAAVLLKRKRDGRPTDSTIEVVASHMVAPKVRVVVLRRQGREFLISVAEKSATLLSEWIEEEQSELPASFVMESPVEADRAETNDLRPSNPRETKPQLIDLGMSPALSGLLSLRSGATHAS